MTDIIIPIPSTALFTAIVGALAAAWTIYQEVRHKLNHGTIRPNTDKIYLQQLGAELKEIHKALHESIPNYPKKSQ